MAVNSYLVDITSQETRTARFAFMEAFFCMGVMLGNPIGTMIRSSMGYVALFVINIILTGLTMLYVALFIKDSIQLVSQERKAVILEARANVEIKCDKGNLMTSARCRPSVQVYAGAWQLRWSAT